MNCFHFVILLYPPQAILRRAHCWHDGLISSHFILFALQVLHPSRHIVSWYSSNHVKRACTVSTTAHRIEARRIERLCLRNNMQSTYHYGSSWAETLLVWLHWLLRSLEAGEREVLVYLPLSIKRMTTVNPESFLRKVTMSWKISQNAIEIV
jgi:hypothetical protein